MPKSLDKLRAALPGLGFAIYAFDPAGPVTLEIHDSGSVTSVEAPTAAEAIERAFPGTPDAEPEAHLAALWSEPAEAPPEPPAEPAEGHPLDIPTFLRREPKPVPRPPQPVVAPDADIFD